MNHLHVFLQLITACVVACRYLGVTENLDRPHRQGKRRDKEPERQNALNLRRNLTRTEIKRAQIDARPVSVEIPAARVA